MTLNDERHEAKATIDVRRTQDRKELNPPYTIVQWES